MDKMILVHVENKYFKRVLLKAAAAAETGIIDVTDIDDLSLKLDAFSPFVCMAVLEITDWNMNSIQVEIDYLKGACPSIPMMAVVSKDTSDVVSFAMRAGIRDIMLLPKNRDQYARRVKEKMQPYFDRFRAQNDDKAQGADVTGVKDVRQQLEDMGLRDFLELEFKRAKRGGYPLSLVMAHLKGEGPEVLERLIRRLNKWLRETDRVFKVDDHTLLGVFPFTQKEHVPVIEEKLREASAVELGLMGNHKKLCLFGSTYPQDETVLDMLLERLENGINNSLVIDSIRSPLNVLSKTEIEEYKQKIRQYKKFL